MNGIAGVIVSRNGRIHLPELLKLLVNQTRKLEEVIVVDNASADGTREFLAEHHPSVTVVLLSTNQGVAGGYSTGLEYALKRRHDWVWMLDQDSRPAPCTLQELVAAYELYPQRERIGVVAPLPVDATTGRPYPLFIWHKRQVALESHGEPVTLVDMVISSGSLIRSDAVRRAGLPRHDFFMDFVDYEHCLRLRECGFLIGVVNRCVMPHTIGKSSTVNFLWKRLSRNTHEPWREYYKVRNRAFVVWHKFPGFREKLFVIRMLLAHMIAVLAFDSHKLTRLRFMWRGIKDGIRGRLGIPVRPND